MTPMTPKRTGQRGRVEAGVTAWSFRRLTFQTAAWLFKEVDAALSGKSLARLGF